MGRVHHIIEVGGPGPLQQSLNAIKMEGLISIIGFLGQGEQPGMLEALMHGCIIRGILVGSRMQFEDMNRAIDVNKIKPVVDDKIFSFEEAKAAYQHVWDQKHFGKTVIKVKA
jgi:D-arabinose 1-dehydrogenase-like Zn-dependent alcohol dehydrogenase